MRGTRRTIVAAAASLAVVLGVGGVAAATSGHGSHSDDPASGTSTSVHVSATTWSTLIISGARARGAGTCSAQPRPPTTVDRTTTRARPSRRHDLDDDRGRDQPDRRLDHPTTVEPRRRQRGCDHDGRDEDADHDARRRHGRPVSHRGRTATTRPRRSGPGSRGHRRRRRRRRRSHSGRD